MTFKTSSSTWGLLSKRWTRSTTSWAPYFKKNFTDKLPEFTGRFCNHWPHINNMVTFQVPIRFRTACATTKEIKKEKKNIPKRTQVNNKRKQQKTPKISQAVSECVREIGYETTQGTRPFNTSLSEHIKKVYLYQTFFLTKSLDCEQCLFSSKFGEGWTQTRRLGECYWMR